jgi:uncharacterized protein (UPF0335 family)
MTTNNSVTADELLQIIQQLESLNLEKKALSDRQKEILVNAKSKGYATNIIKLIIKERSRTADEVSEENTLLEIYKGMLGMT